MVGVFHSDSLGFWGVYPYCGFSGSFCSPEAWKHGELIGKWSYSQLRLQVQPFGGQEFAVLEVLGHHF